MSENSEEKKPMPNLEPAINPPEKPGDPSGSSETSPVEKSRWIKLLSLSALNDIDPDKVQNSTAFKLGALAGLLPALSVMSLTQFLAPADLPGSGAANSDSSVLTGLLVLFSSALVGGSVAFFWAENRLRTIFTYGVAGPTVVLSLFLSGISNVAANKRVQNVKDQVDNQIDNATKEAKTKATEVANNEVKKIISATSQPTSPAPPDIAPTASNPDLGIP